MKKEYQTVGDLLDSGLRIGDILDPDACWELHKVEEDVEHTAQLFENGVSEQERHAIRDKNTAFLMYENEERLKKHFDSVRAA